MPDAAHPGYAAMATAYSGLRLAGLPVRGNNAAMMTRSHPMPLRSFGFLLPVLLLLAWDVQAMDADASQAIAGKVRINQLGFAPDANKLAVVEREAAGGFRVVREEDGEVVLQGVTGPAVEWEPADRVVTVADFSDLRTPGRYRVEVDGLPPSDVFPVRDGAYAELADAALKAFYFNRAGIPLSAEHAGQWARAAGHPDDRVKVHASAASVQRPAGTLIKAPYGWYDAGDYNKYVVNSGISMHALLSAWEHFPEFFRDRDIGIPESGNGVPDILDEAWWNLRWMLDMQDPHDGGVYHKLTNLHFDGSVMPDQATAERYVVQKGTAATLDFAAVMAMAARIYADHEAHFPGVPARMRAAAESAWGWAQANPSVEYIQPPDVHTGGYGDKAFDDEFAWAAAELYLLTGDRTYLRAFEQYSSEPSVPSWARVGSLGWMSLAGHLDRLPDDNIRARIRDGMDAVATRLAAQWQDSAWRVGMRGSDFPWGSNAVVMNQAMLLLQGYRLSGERRYLDAAQSQLDYVLGRNPLGISYVTGHGLRTPMHIHHRPSEADGIAEPVPGWLSGGPNPRQQDAGDCPVRYPSSLPALSWLDHQCSYASNEVAINWNAPLVYVVSAIEALTPKD